MEWEEHNLVCVWGICFQVNEEFSNFSFHQMTQNDRKAFGNSISDDIKSNHIEITVLNVKTFNKM